MGWTEKKKTKKEKQHLGCRKRVGKYGLEHF
jgi:hypothetical protein